MILRLLPRAIGAGVGAVVVTALVAIGVEPTGAASPAGLVPASSRLAASVPIADVRVLVVSTADDALGVLVAYRGEKGWLAVRPEPVSPATEVAWTSTPGGGPVPALAIAYGRTSGAAVDVQWADGRLDTVRPGDDGTWVDVRRGRAAVSVVRTRDRAGRVTSTVAGP
jgi:hypothetical protein